MVVASTDSTFNKIKSSFSVSTALNKMATSGLVCACHMTCTLVHVSSKNWRWIPVMSMICVLLFLLCYFTISRIGRKCTLGHLKEVGGVVC